MTAATGLATDALLAGLRSAVGHSGPPSLARHPVNEPMIAHWCDAMGDVNPCYTDAGFASASVHGGIVAPPMMLDVWERPGLQSASHSGSPRMAVLETLEAAGYESIVAVNTELEIVRYLRPGEVVSGVETLESVSDAKRTALGSGFFVTTRHRYTVASGEHVGSLMFRVLKFRPPAPDHGGGGQATPSPKGGADGDPSRRPRPAVNRDNAFFWEGAARHELRIQRCNRCGQLIMPAGPRCPACGSFEPSFIVSAGRGRLYSYAVPHHPQVPGFDYPLLVGLVELEEGVRMVANLVGLEADQLRIGMPVELTWLDSHPAAPGLAAVSLPQFRAASPQHRNDTLRIDDIAVGDALPVSSIPITTTLIVAGAIATRDYTEVHHDRDIARARGSRDVFLNINTSVGLLQRVVSDWAGPHASFRSVRIRLGAPAYPGDVLSFSGSVTTVDRATGTVEVGAKFADSLGDHLVGTVALELPPGPR